ncbi:MAG: hypothetical protein ABJB69_06875 [Spartobacteria bacterium]
MKISHSLFSLIGSLVLLGAASARDLTTATPETTGTKSEEETPLDIITTETGYVFESDLKNHGNFGSQYELQNQFEYGHRIQLNGNLYIHLGLAYERFDFGNTNAPVPVHLQKMAGVIGLDYMKGADTGAFLQFRPGFYTEEHIGSASFDCPILLGRFWILQPDKLYLLTGAYASFLRGGFPVLPLVGLVWKPNDQFRLMAIVPEPRAIYTFNKQLEVWVGGQLVGGSFRTDHHDEYLNIKHVAKLSGTQVDYSDYRAGAGLTYSLTHNIALDFGGGYSIRRSFDYNRAGEDFRADSAPYARLEIKAAF